MHRVEVAAPIYDSKLRDQIRSMFRTQLADNVKAREQQPDGSYAYVLHEEPEINAQEQLYQMAYDAVGASVTRAVEEEVQ